jgi:hypothetical protein
LVFNCYSGRSRSLSGGEGGLFFKKTIKLEKKRVYLALASTAAGHRDCIECLQAVGMHYHNDASENRFKGFVQLVRAAKAAGSVAYRLSFALRHLF